MENLPPLQPEQLKHVPLQVGPLSEETDKLLRQYLKMQIGMTYWSFITKISIFILVVGSIIVSTLMLAPLVESQMGMLKNLQSLTLPGGPQSGVNTEQLNDIIKQLQQSK
mgnify:CR=1 FL=1